jgi:hypothetical protein
MSASLVVSVGSTIESKTTSSSAKNISTYTKDVSKELKVEVEKIRYTNAIAAKNAVSGNNYFVLMKVDRKALFNEKKKSFELDDKRLADQYAGAAKKPVFEQILLLQDIYPSVIKNKKRAFVLHAINNSFDHGPYFEKYDGYIDKISKLKDEITISVRSNETKNYFADELIDMLNEKKFKISQNHPKMTVSINNKARYSTARGWQIAKVSTTLSVIVEGKTISNKTINSVGRSSSTKENALQDAAIRFKKEIEDLTLDKVLFKK